MERANPFHEKLHVLKSRMDKMDRSTGSKTEVFRFIKMVPNKPSNIFLGIDDKNSTEYMLKSETCDDKTKDTVTAVAQGIGGAEKTCTLCARGLHDDVNVNILVELRKSQK